MSINSLSGATYPVLSGLHLPESRLLERRERRCSASESRIMASAQSVLAEISREMAAVNEEIVVTKDRIIFLESQIEAEKVVKQQLISSHVGSFDDRLEELESSLLRAEAKGKELAHPPCSAERTLAHRAYQELVAGLEESRRKRLTLPESGVASAATESMQVALVEKINSVVGSLLARVQERELFVTRTKAEISEANARAEQLDAESYEIQLAGSTLGSTRMRRPKLIKGMKSYLEGRIVEMRAECACAEQRAYEMERMLDVVQHPRAMWRDGHQVTLGEERERDERVVQALRSQGYHIAAEVCRQVNEEKARKMYAIEL